jgi:predicted dehydrogenase/threonine dehydrogenase-like Zn-dependent dehydrogenase
MIQLLQSLKDGSTQIVHAPVPLVSPSTLLVQSRTTVISPGTERMLVEFGKAGWIEKARSQPDKVKQVLEKVRADGVAPTLEAVRAKLDSPIPLGYCQAGVVVDTGKGVTGFPVGTRVVTNGPHAEYVRVAPTLAACIPDGIPFEHAAFTPLAAIALQGLRLARPELGETVVVYGLGLIGLLAVQLARAAGCSVIGIDRSAERCALAREFGAMTVTAEDGRDVATAVMELTSGIGADIVLLTLATDADEPVHQSATMSRKRGRIILVGVTGLDLRRDDFYRKELSFQVSCSYGPGRYDPAHEEKGIDYPLPYVRWTEGRNFEAVLALMGDGRLDPAPLISHRFPINDAEAAYRVVVSGESSLGIILDYPASSAEPATTITLGAAPRTAAKARLGVIGAGNFSSRVLIPAFRAANASLEMIASAGGLSAAVVGKRLGFARATTDAESVVSDPAVDTVVVATRHDSHANWVLRSLEAGKNVFVEKPLALSMDDLDRIEAALVSARGILCVGFNRRFAPHVVAARRMLGGRAGPLAISITVNAGKIPVEHWTQDPGSGGGRIAGEGCHFIDLARFLAGSPISDIQVAAARASDEKPVTDVAILQLKFEDGSIGSIQYLSNGSRGFPKERVELFFDGNVVRLDNFRRVETWGDLSSSGRWPSRQDKGHSALVAAFVESVRSGGKPPIPIEELLEASRWTVRAAELARHGRPNSS